MRFLVRVEWPGLGMSAHIADAHDRPLCRVRINPPLWRIVDVDAAAVSVICRHCRFALRTQEPPEPPADREESQP